MAAFLIIWISVFVLRMGVYLGGSLLLSKSTSLDDGKEYWGIACLIPVMFEHGFAHQFSAEYSEGHALFFPLFAVFLLATSALIAYGLCRWFKLL